MPTSVGSRDTAAHSFRAEIYTVSINRCVDVPPEVSEALGGQTHIQVKGTVCRKVFSSNLAPRGDGAHRLFIHSKIWRRLGVDIGDAVDVTVKRDDQKWEIVIPPDLAEAMPPAATPSPHSRP
jgi:hypothetical protein